MWLSLCKEWQSKITQCISSTITTRPNPAATPRAQAPRLAAMFASTSPLDLYIQLVFTWFGKQCSRVEALMVWVAEHRTDCKKPLSKSLLGKFELRFPNTSSCLFSRWAEAAMMWVAEESEHRTEREKLANAMAASLAEEEERKTSAVPLPDRPDAELRQRFAASLLLPQVRKYMNHKIAGSGKRGRQQQRHDWDVQRRTRRLLCCRTAFLHSRT